MICIRFVTNDTIHSFKISIISVLKCVSIIIKSLCDCSPSSVWVSDYRWERFMAAKGEDSAPNDVAQDMMGL